MNDGLGAGGDGDNDSDDGREAPIDADAVSDDAVADDEREALVTIAVQNGIQVVLLRHFEGLWPFDRTYLTPLAAGGVTLVAMWGIREVVTGLAAVVVGAVAGLAVYAGALHALGVDPRDRLVARELAGQYRAARRLRPERRHFMRTAA